MGGARPLIGIAASTGEDILGPTSSLGRAYVDAVATAGGIPFVVPILDPRDAPDVLSRLDGLVLSGGGDVDPARYGAEPHASVYGVNPDRDAWELALIGAATLPVLAICRGMQLVNVAAGGTLVQHVPDVTALPHRLIDRSEELVHDVDVVAGSRLAAVTGAVSLGVNSLHHQAVDRVGVGLRVVARAPDGVVEALEPDDGRALLAVQWHPEWLVARPLQLALFRWLVEAAGAAPDLGVALGPIAS